MYLRLSALAAACGILVLSGCGGGGDDDIDNSPRTFTTQIYSDPVFDGDIEQVSPDVYTVTQGMSSSVQSVLAGIDPVGGTEFRAFLDFPLGGAGGVPSRAIIDSAFLEIYIDDLQPLSGRLPIRVDLVEFQPPTLVATALQPFRAACPRLHRADSRHLACGCGHLCADRCDVADARSAAVSASRTSRCASWKIWARPFPC